MKTKGREGIAAELLTVRARNQFYCLDVASIREIVPATSFRFNEQSDTPYGWVPAGHETIPVHSLSWLVQGVHLGDPRQGRVIVVEDGDECRGLLVDSFDSPAPNIPVRFYPLPDAVRGPRSSYTRGVAYLGERPMLYLAIERLRPLPLESRQAWSEADSKTGPRIERRVRSGDIAICFAKVDHPESSVPLELAVDVEQVCEFLEAPTIVAVHEAGEQVMGIADWRGTPAPVINIFRCLDLEDWVQYSSPGYVVVRAGEGDELVAIPTSEDPRVLKLSSPGSLPNGLFGMPSALVRGVTRGAGSFVVVVEAAALLDPQLLREVQPAYSL